MSKLLLLSGGLDSVVLLHTEPGVSLCLGFDYGQPHKVELEQARYWAETLGVEYREVKLPNLPRVNDVVFAGRNAVMLALAAAVAQEKGLSEVLIGCNGSDSDRFPDCRLDFLRGMNKTLSAYGVTVYAPLLNKTKAQIVGMAKQLGISPGTTWTCYSPKEGKPCGGCYSCKGLEVAYASS